MNKNNILDAKTLLAMASNVKEILNTKSVSLSVFVSIIGLLVIVLCTWVEDKSSSAYIGGNTLAIVLVIWGFYRLLFRRMVLVYGPTQSKIVAGSFYFDIQHLDKLKRVISSDEDADYSQFDFMKSGNSRMDYMVSTDGNFVAVQLFQYIPYTYEVASDVLYFEEDAAKKLGEHLLINHKILN